MKTKRFYKKSKDQLYSSFGFFAMSFEELFLSIKFCLINVLEQKGLADKRFSRITFARHTAEPLKITLLSYLGEYYSANTDALVIITELFKKIDAAIELRNRLIHSFWAIGFGETIDQTIAVGLKDKTTKYGLEGHQLILNSRDFRRFGNEVNKLRMLVEYLDECIRKNIKIPSRLMMV